MDHHMCMFLSSEISVCVCLCVCVCMLNVRLLSPSEVKYVTNLVQIPSNNPSAMKSCGQSHASFLLTFSLSDCIV